MYDVIVDIDGVLLDIHSGMKARFARRGYRYDVKNVYTYDFNKSLPDEEQFRKIPSRALIYEMLEDPELYKSSPCDWDSVLSIRQHAERGLTFLIYTLSPNLKVQFAKQTLFSQWFLNTKNITFSSVVPSGDNKCGFKGGVCGRTVVEDCHINLREYDDDVFKYLVDKPYNKENYNPDYFDVFHNPTVLRCDDTYQAIEMAAAKAMMLKYKETSC